ncbi:MAG TPA: prepilin-type N-terminal cleavage/methylation domain-containing protein [Methanoregulaceae archaeon]|nr:prepilin-type N-terminal cleavage/methylation domain-containing protein [Methanoregulaceae archaeon]
MMTRRAFTLIELLIVVSIIGIIAAIAVPNFMDARTRALIANGYADMNAIKTSTSAFMLDNNVMLVDFYDDDTEMGIKRIIERFNNVGLPENPSSWRSAKDILLPLTSPISYLSKIPRAPFPQLYYHNNYNLDMPLTENIAQFEYWDNDPLINAGIKSMTSDYDPSKIDALVGGSFPEGSFLVMCCGPSKEDWANGAPSAWHYRVLPYDTSNGLYSRGVLFTCSGP